MDPLLIFELFDYYYIVAVILSIEFMKVYVPRMNAVDKRILTLLSAVSVAAAFIGLKLYMNRDGATEEYAQKLLISFFGVTSLYEFIVKPILAKVKKVKEV